VNVGRRRSAVLGGACAIALVGLIAEWQAYGPDGYASRGAQPWYPWILDFVTGATFVVAGAVAALRRPASLVGPLLMLTALAWFAATLVQPSRFVGTELVPSLVFLYRGFLAHAILTFPSGRPADRIEWIAVGVAYATSLLAPLWYQPLVGLALVALLVGVSWRGYRRAPAWSRPARRDALTLAIVAAATVVALTAGRLLGVPYPLDDALTIGFHVALMGIALGLTSSLVHSERTGLTDLVVELGESSRSSLGDELSRLIGDPSLCIGTWAPDAGGYVLADGRVLSPPDTGSTLAATRVDREAERLALVVHQRGALDDPELRQAVVDAVRLAVANARLRARVEAQVAELAASRRRLVLAADAEGRRLEQRLQDGAVRHLGVVGVGLEAASRTAGEGARGPLTTAIERCRERLEGVKEDLGNLAGGLYPRSLSEYGLAAALVELARDCPVPVELDVRVGQAPPSLATDAYLACAEALANSIKHAQATSVYVQVAEAPGRLTISVTDDGVGGASMDRGTGLRGLADRLASVGGTLAVEDGPDSGTRVAATLPLPPGDGPATVTNDRAHRSVETRTAGPEISLVSTDGAPVTNP
jgi:signal transduction histidine kinase